MPSFEVTYEEGVRSYTEAVAQGDDELAAMGFPMAERPTEVGGELANRPNIPSNLSKLSMAELTDLLGYATEWYRYAMEVLPVVTSERNAAESARDFAWAKIRKSHTGRVADKDNETRCDSRYVEAAARFETCDYKYRRVKAICDGLLREVETISRAMAGQEQVHRAEGTHLAGVRSAYRAKQGPMGRVPTSNFFVKKGPTVPKGHPIPEDDD